MPEGHTLHRPARDLAELVGSEVSTTSPQGRFPSQKVDGQRLTRVDAYGKHLLVEVANGVSVHVNLGTRGKWLRFTPVTGKTGRRVAARSPAGRRRPARGVPVGGRTFWERRGRVAEPWAWLQEMMSQAVDDGRIITADAEERRAVPQAKSRRVYKQGPCHDCGRPIVTGTIDGRPTYACPRCQPEWAG